MAPPITPERARELLRALWNALVYEAQDPMIGNRQFGEGLKVARDEIATAHTLPAWDQIVPPGA